MRAAAACLAAHCVLSGDARWSAPQLREQLAELAARVTDIEVEYRSYSYEASQAPGGAYFHKRIAALAPSLFQLESGHGYDGLDWRDDPFRQITYVGSTRVVTYTLLDRSFFEYAIPPDAALPGTLDNEFYFVATGLWPLPARVAPGGDVHPQVLAHVARHGSFDAVRPRLETVSGRACHVLEWVGRDALWLDAERGCAVLRREKRDADGALQFRYELGDHREHAPNLWLPRWIVREDFAPPSDKAARTVRMEILSTSVGQLAPAAFEFSAPPGAIQFQREDPDGSLRQVVDGGQELLDGQAQWIGRVHPRTERRSLSLLWLACGVALLAVVAGVELRTRARRRKLHATSIVRV